MPTTPLPRPEYPRPQFVRENWINLNGTWTYAFDPGKSGVQRGLQAALHPRLARVKDIGPGAVQVDPVLAHELRARVFGSG